MSASTMRTTARDTEQHSQQLVSSGGNAMPVGNVVVCVQERRIAMPVADGVSGLKALGAAVSVQCSLA